MPANLEHGIDKEGIVDGNFVETYYRVMTAARVDKENGFVAFVMDDGGVDLETRMPIEALVKFLKDNDVV